MAHDWTPEEAEGRKEISYPLNNRWYTAKYPQAFHATRTSGVFSADDNLQLRPGGGLKVRLGAGHAWMRIDRFKGVVYAQTDEEGKLFDVPPPHGNLLRLDRLALRFDYILNDVFSVYKVGVPGQPAPALQRDAEAYELHIYEVRVAAGTLEISNAMIGDLRTNESVCGIMRDSVTGIPTQQLYDNFTSWMETVRGELYAFFFNYQELTQEQYDIYTSNLNGFFNTFQDNMNLFMEVQQTDFIAWYQSVKDIMGDEIAGELTLMIQDLQKEMPVAVVGTVSNSLGRYPVCNLYKTENAAGLSGAGMTAAGGENIVSVPARFEFDGYNTIRVSTIMEFAEYTTISKINDQMYAFLAENSNKSLLLTIN